MFKEFFSDNKVKTFAISELVIYLLLLLIYIFRVGGIRGILLAGDLFGVLASFVTTLLCFHIWRRLDKKELSKKIWGALTLGFGFWFFGEFLWFYYEIILQQEIPYPSLADVSWLLGYIPIAYGLYIRFKSFRISPDRKQWIGLIATYSVILIILLSVLIVPILTYPDYESTIVKYLDAIYPIADLLVLFFLLLIFMVTQGGQMSTTWLVIAVGIFMVVIGDSLFSYGYWNEIYYPEGLINTFTIVADMTYYASYTIIALGVYKELLSQRT